MAEPSAYDLWQQAGGESAHTFDRDLFVELMYEGRPYPSRADLEAAMAGAIQDRSDEEAGHDRR